jgi:DNA-binding CsgD family transcriptional regulator
MEQQRLSLRKHDIVGSIEAAYLLEADEQAWMQGLLHSIRPTFDQGLGVMGYFYDASGENMRAWGVAGDGAPPGIVETTIPIIQGLGPAALKTMFQCPRVMASASDILSPERIHGYIASTAMGAAQFADTVGIKCHEPEGWGVMIGCGVPQLTTVDRQTEGNWSRLAAHITAALRIRRRLQGGSSLTQSDAVLNPRGTVAHAETAAKDAGVREALSRAVRSREVARGPLRRNEPDEAADLWQALVDGRWSLLDQLDTDGRRWILARRNAPVAVDAPPLTPREQQVLAYVALGHSNKLVAYTLGTTSSAVGNLIARASRKLRVSSRVELIQRWNRGAKDKDGFA